MGSTFRLHQNNTTHSSFITFNKDMKKWPYICINPIFDYIENRHSLCSVATELD